MGPLIGQGGAEVAVQQAQQPLHEPAQGRQVEAQLCAKGGHGFRRGGLAEHGLGDITGEHADRQEDDHRDGEQRQQAEGQALEHQFE